MTLKDLFSKKNDYGDEGDYRQKLIRHHRGIAIRIAISVLIAASVCVGIYVFFQQIQYKGYSVSVENERRDSEKALYVSYGENVVKYSPDGAEAFDGRNNRIWNITYEMQNPKIAVNGSFVALGDFKATKIYTINDEGDSAEIETKLPVSDFCISEQGVVACVLESENENRIHLYTYDGNIIADMKCTMTKSGYPVDISISKDGLKLAVSYVRIEGGKLKSSVAFYNFGEVGKNEIDNLVSAYDYVDSVVPKVNFINNNTAFALGDNRLVIYKGTQKPVSSFETFLNEEVQSVFYGENCVGLVFRDARRAGCYRLDVYDENGKIKLSQDFDMQYTDIVLKDDYAIIYNETRAVVYKFNGRLKFEGEFDQPVLLLVPGGSFSKWTLANRSSVRLVRLN